jgi:hypothetical protein
VEVEWSGPLAGPVVRIGRSDPLWLPLTGAQVYRKIRGLLHAARAQSADSLKLSVLDLPGKSHVEVVATFGRRGERTRSLAVALPRYEAARLAAGFAEAARS